MLSLYNLYKEGNKMNQNDIMSNGKRRIEEEVYAMRDYLKSLNAAVDKIEAGSEAEAGYIAEKIRSLISVYERGYGFSPILKIKR